MAPIKFMLGALKLPLGVQLWLMVLMTVNAVLPLFFLARFEARIVLGTFFLSFLLMVVITARNGFTRLLGFGHVLWVPLVAFLVTRLGAVPEGDPYRLWLMSVIALNSVSLVIDAVDVIRFARGEREEIVSL